MLANILWASTKQQDDKIERPTPTAVANYGANSIWGPKLMAPHRPHLNVGLSISFGLYVVSRANWRQLVGSLALGVLR